MSRISPAPFAAISAAILNLLSLLTSIPAHGATPAAADERSRGAEVDALLSPLMQRPGSPGVAVGLYQHGRLIYEHGYGLADLDHSVPVTAQTVFNLASLSKQFTAFSIALLAREGKLDLQADIRTYLPDMPDLGQRITVADLVHHVSGLREYITLAALSGHDDQSRLTRAQAIALVRRQRELSFSPGTQYEYTNSNYALLAQIVRAVSGMSLRDFMQLHIFGPLGMTKTRLHDDMSRVEPDYAVGYEAGENGAPWTRAVYNREAVGPGNVLSNVGDMMKWAGNLLHPTVGERALIDQLTAPAALRDGTPLNYGFGLRRTTIAGHLAITHNGSVPGFNTKIAILPEDDFAIVVLANRPVEVEELTDRMVSLYLQPRPGSGKVPTLVSPERGTLSALAGSYQGRHGQMVLLERGVAGSFTLRTLGGTDLPIHFWADGTFGPGEYEHVHYRAVRDNARQVSALQEIHMSAGTSNTRTLERVPAAVPSPEMLASLAGTYHGDEIDTTFELTVESGHLTLQSLYLPEPQVLAPSAFDRFDCVAGALSGLSLRVERGAAGQPEALLLDYQGVQGMRLQRVH